MYTEPLPHPDTHLSTLKLVELLVYTGLVLPVWTSLARLSSQVLVK